MGDVGNNGAYARLRAQATSMRKKPSRLVTSYKL